MKRCVMGWLLGVCLVGAAALWFGWPQPVVERPLVIWSGRNIPELTALGREFTARTGRAVQVETPGNFVEKFEILAQQGQGPDIIIWAHDRFAAWAQAGLLEIIPASALPQGYCLPEAAARLREGQDRGAGGIGCWVIRCNWSPRCCSGIALSCRRRRGPIANFPAWPEPYLPESICWAGI